MASVILRCYFLSLIHVLHDVLLCVIRGVAFESLMPTTLPFSATKNAKRRASEKKTVMSAVQAAAASSCGRRIWILKDAALNQGQACTILDEPAEISAYLDAATAPLVVQVCHVAGTELQNCS
eukprot:SAG31_NODE_4063_length_3625_cov_1.344016_3_plen_123_part_00